MKKYKHLSQEERDRIQALFSSGHLQKEIAEVIGRDEGTISRELNKGSMKNGAYKAEYAHHKAYLRKKYARYQGKKINENEELKVFIIKGLILDWNPDEISGRMKEQKLPYYASKTAIYEWLYSIHGQLYCPLLPSKQYRKKKRKKKKTKKEMIPNRVGIEEKPFDFGLKSGDMETDTIVSGKKTGSTAALTGVKDVFSKLIGLRKICSLKPALNEKAIDDILLPLNTRCLVRDNGIENRNHEQALVPSFFCHPYSSYEKPHIENANKELRKYFPKGCDLNDYSQEDVSLVEWLLNNKPRKILGYKTPYEVARESGLIRQPLKVSRYAINLINFNCPSVALQG
ncbi:MAG: IS30 family transposase [Candidatus Paceibacterota bacterium]